MMFMLLLVFCDLMVFTTGLSCDPLKHQYYMPQAKMCLNCEKCLIGEEPISVQEWDIEITQKEGPTECRKCIPCRKGTVSEFRAFGCKACIDCAAKGMFVKTNCTASRDTECTNIIRTTTEAPHRLTPPKQLYTTLRPTQKQSEGTPRSGQTSGPSKTPNFMVVSVIVIAVAIFLIILVVIMVVIQSKKVQGICTGKMYHQIRDIEDQSTASQMGVGNILVVDEETDQCEDIIDKTDTHTLPNPGSKRRCSTKAKAHDKNQPLNQYRTRENSLPSDVYNSRFELQTTWNEKKSNLQTDGDNTSETNSRIPGFTRQFSYPLDNSVAKPKITDNQILAKMSENTLLNIQDVVEECSNIFQENIVEEIKNWKLEDKDLHKLSLLLINNNSYKDVGYFLGLSSAHMWEISQDYPYVKEQSIQTLLRAQMLKPIKMTVADIDRVLKELHQLDILEKFKDYIADRINESQSCLLPTTS